MSKDGFDKKNPDQIFYSESSIKEKLSYLHTLRHSLEQDVDTLWEHENEWINTISESKMKKIDIQTDLDFLINDMKDEQKSMNQLKSKGSLIEKRINKEYGQAGITDTKHFKIIAMVLMVIFILCLFSFYFFIAFVIVSCGYFIYVYKTYLKTKKEERIKAQEKSLLDKQLQLIKDQYAKKHRQLAKLDKKRKEMEEQVNTLTEQYESLQSKLESYKQKRNDLEKTKQFLSILKEYS